MVFTKYDDFHTIDWLRDNAMDRERHRRFNKVKKHSTLDWLRSGMDASSAWICVFLVGLACGKSSRRHLFYVLLLSGSVHH